MWLWKTNSPSSSPFPLFLPPFSPLPNLIPALSIPQYSFSPFPWLWIKCVETWMYIFVFSSSSLQMQPSLKWFFAIKWHELLYHVLVQDVRSLKANKKKMSELTLLCPKREILQWYWYCNKGIRHKLKHFLSLLQETGTLR